LPRDIQHGGLMPAQLPAAGSEPASEGRGQRCRLLSGCGQDRHQALMKSSTDTPACFRMARSVPSGMSPGWFGTVVYRFVERLYQISWLPAA
jgi:hypothetical protein